MAHPTHAPTRQTNRAWHPTDYLRVLYKRRWIAIPGFLVIFVSSAISSVRTVPLYEATTQIMIDEDAKRSTSLDSVTTDASSWMDDDFLPTQYKILQSRALALRTARALEQELSAGDRAAGRQDSRSA